MTLVAAIAFAVVIATDLNEMVVRWGAAHPQFEWLGIEELPMGFALLGLGTGWFGFRRWRQYSEENKAHLRALDLLNVAMSEVVAANQAKTQFLAAMSHELRTPLNAILGFSELIRDQAVGPMVTPNYREYAGDIHDSGKHLLSIVNGILDMAQLEAGALTFEIAPTDLSAVIHQVVRMIAHRAFDGRVKIDVAIADEIIVDADHGKLQQAFLNVAHNAVKFTPPGGSVTLGCRIEGDMACLQVTDTGIGIAESDIPAALTPFCQIDGSLQRRYEGTGLGLPLAKRYVEKQGGALTLESRLGLGTIVTITLPLSSSPHRRQPVEADYEKTG
ncbi:MAG TPA: HAMP domain-containing sensor histidine kinase [Stellaceae bacterium]|nr:HAMP domain-containing sensor histidine kinase [Stellaceae bacterium]